MTLADLQLMLFEGFCLSIVYSCFCRASHTNKANTKRDVRWAFSLLGVVSIVGAAVPFAGYEPDPVAVMFAGATAAVQLVTSFHWRRGVPAQFRKDPP